MAYIEWLVLAAGGLFLVGSLAVLVVVVAVKLYRRGRAASQANPYVGQSLRERMDAEDKDEAERVVNALYATNRYLEGQAERDAKMKGLVNGLQGIFGGAPRPNA